MTRFAWSIVLDYFEEHPSQVIRTSEVIAAYPNVKPAIIREYLKRLVAMNLLERTQHGYYRLAQIKAERSKESNLQENIKRIKAQISEMHGISVDKIDIIINIQT